MKNKKTIIIVSSLVIFVSFLVYILQSNIFYSQPYSDNTASFEETKSYVKNTIEKREENNVAIVISNDKAILNVDAYHESCQMDIEPRVYIYENESWVMTDEMLPLYEPYFLDGEYHEFVPTPMCDMVAYWKIKNPIEISLPKFLYSKVGVTNDLKNQDNLIQNFETKEFTGKIKIELEYCTDNTCNSKEIFSATLNENKEILSTVTSPGVKNQ